VQLAGTGDGLGAIGRGKFQQDLATLVLMTGARPASVSAIHRGDRRDDADSTSIVIAARVSMVVAVCS
jgi:hypothetical protein